MLLSRKPGFPYGFVIFASLLFLAAIIIENINKRFWLYDFQVYYSAAKALMADTQVYGIPFGLDSGYYKYAPFVLLLFAPYGMLPLKAACVIHFAVLSLCFIGSFLLLKNLTDRCFFEAESRRPNVVLTISLICVLVHIARELHLGNVNIVLVMLVCLGLKYLLESREVPAGMLLGLTMVFKPYFMLLLLPLIFHRKFRALVSLSLTGLASVLIPTVVLGFDKSLSLHREWLHSMMDHSSYLSSPHTLLSLVRTYIAPQAPDGLAYVFIGLVAVLYGLFFWVNHRRNQTKSNPAKEENASLMMGTFGLLAVIPNLVITDTEHFLYLLSVIVFSVAYFSCYRSYGLLVLFILLVLGYGSNSSDLLGRDLSNWVHNAGVLGICNLAIIALGFFLYFRLHRNEHPIQAPNAALKI
jgi:hypothetical protein